MSSEPRLLLSTGQAGKLLGCDPKTVAKMCADHIFPNARPTRPGGPWRIPKAEVLAHIESMKPKKRIRQTA